MSNTNVPDARSQEGNEPMSLLLQKQSAIYQSNMRAEDGCQNRGSWNSLCEGILIPLGSLFAVFLTMLGLMLLAD